VRDRYDRHGASFDLRAFERPLPRRAFLHEFVSQGKIQGDRPADPHRLGKCFVPDIMHFDQV